MGNNFILNGSFSGGSVFISLLPVALLIFFIWYLKKKRTDEAKENSRFGRRGKKDHIWQILKEYHKKKNQTGSIIEISFLFERPHPNDLEDYLKRAHKFRVKREAKKSGIKSNKKDKPDFTNLKNYFEILSEETLSLRNTESINTVKSHKVEAIINNIPKQRKKRKRYVILYKIRQRQWVSNWLAIEVELIKQNTKEGKTKDSVVVNKELDVEMEMKWIDPLLHEKIEIKNKKIEEDKKKTLKAQKKIEKLPLLVRLGLSLKQLLKRLKDFYI